MSRHFCVAQYLAAVLVCCLAAGCFRSAPPSGGSKSGAGHPKTNDSPTPGGEKVAATTGRQKFWPDYPDVPYVEVMTEVDGIEIPRLQIKSENLQIKGTIPADVGNEYAKKHPGKPATGDRLIVRFNSEPKTLNPIVETSAVQQYVGEYVSKALARQNPETLLYEPDIAERWVAEDSVKLSPNYPGKERRIAVGDGKPAAELEIDYRRAEKEGQDDPVLSLTTYDAGGEPLGGVWVGLYPIGKIPGAPTTGYHRWSDERGKLKVSSLVSGKYKVRVGAEVFGKTERSDDGSLTVSPQTPGNPLSEELKSASTPKEQQSLTLAKGEWVDVQEQTIYTYFLRREAKWSDGNPFTTKDLEFAYAVVNNAYVDGESLRVYYHDLVACEALDPYTIRMKYRRQYFKSFEFTAGLAAYAPPWHQFVAFFKRDGKTLTLERLTPDEEKAQKKVSAHGQVFGKFFNTDDRYNRKPLGTGPYVVDKWVRADRVELRRNPDCWDREHGGYVDRLIFKFIPDNVTAMQALKAGEIDFLYRMDSEQYFEDLAGPPDWFKAKYVKAAWYSPGFGYVGWNLLKPMFQDRRVRIALSLLFNKQEFVEKKLHNEAVLVSASQYYFGPGYDHEVKPLGYDPEVARDLLAAAGWVDTDNDGILDKDGKKFEFTYLQPPGSPVAKDRAALIQRSYKKVGIQMNIRQFEWASFIDKVKSKDFDAVNLGWASPIESDPFQIWHGSQAGADKRGSNHVSFNNAEADALIEQLRVTLDLEKRKRIHWSFHRILDREQPYMFLYTAKDFGGYHRRFQGVKWYRVRPGFDLAEWYVPKDQQLH